MTALIFFFLTAGEDPGCEDNDGEHRRVSAREQSLRRRLLHKFSEQEHCTGCNLHQHDSVRWSASRRRPAVHLCRPTATGVPQWRHSHRQHVSLL